jgi:anti-anti-sigma factor
MKRRLPSGIGGPPPPVGQPTPNRSSRSRPSAPELREELLRVIRRWGPQLIIDLGGVTLLDCAGLGVLMATRRRAHLEGGWVRLVRVPPRARRMISLLRLDQAFELGT